MKVEKTRGGMTGPYYVIKLNIAGVDCMFRMPDNNYSQLAYQLTGDYEKHDAECIKQAIESAFQID